MLGCALVCPTSAATRSWAANLVGRRLDGPSGVESVRRDSHLEYMIGIVLTEDGLHRPAWSGVARAMPIRAYGRASGLPGVLFFAYVSC